MTAIAYPYLAVAVFLPIEQESLHAVLDRMESTGSTSA